jgi:hypothetical protein
LFIKLIKGLTHIKGLLGSHFKLLKNPYLFSHIKKKRNNSGLILFGGQMREKSKREVSRDVLSFFLIDDAGVIKCN